MKKLVSLALVLALCLAVPAPALAFSDVPAGHPFYEAVARCAGKGIAGGYSDGTFRPGGTVSRAAFCVMLSRAFYAEAVAEREDTRSVAWFVPNAIALRVSGVLAGLPFADEYAVPGTMERPISRQEMARLVTNVLAARGYGANAEEKALARAGIADYGDIAPEYRDAVENVFALGLISGYDGGVFRGAAFMNRGQACGVIDRVLRYIPEDGPPTLADGRDITEENVLDVLAVIRKEYPDGTSWGGSAMGASTNQNTWGASKAVNALFARPEWYASTIYACGGWAAMCDMRIFGNRAGGAFRPVEDLSALRPGDLLLQLDAEGVIVHYCVVCRRAEGDGVWTCDGNINAVGDIYNNHGGVVKWDKYRADLKAVHANGRPVYTAFTRYPGAEEAGAAS